MSMTYIRTDKNGTKIYHDYACPRCGGRGGADAWVYTGWTCYECGGTGKANKPRIFKEYTPEYRAILDARAKKREEKRIAAAREKHGEWKIGKGFVDDKIHVVGIEDSFSVKDAIKAAGGRFNEYTGWYFSEAHDEFKTVEITADEALIELSTGMLDWRNDIRETVWAKIPETSKHVGNVGDKVEVEVTHTHTGSFESGFGHNGYYTVTTYVHTFKDADGNVFVWKTSSVSGFENETFRIKGTVKAHDEYRGVKQTVLTRCKVA
jgi:hypothetical protein